MRVRSRIASTPGQPLARREPPAGSPYHDADRPAKEKPSTPSHVGLGGSPARPTPAEVWRGGNTSGIRSRSRNRIPRTASSRSDTGQE
jgi:hypothetical protein